MAEQVGKREEGRERPRASSTTSGLKTLLNTVVEVGFLFGIIVAAERLFGDKRIGAYGFHPHPYWLVVLPMAAARGVGASFLASACGTVLYLFGAWQEIGSDRIHDYLTLDTMLEPILFFFVGFLVGEFRDLTLTRYRELARKLDETRTQAGNMRQQRDVVSEANRLLEKRLVDQSTQFGNLMLTATRIEHAGRKEVFEIALELVEEHCGAAGSVLMPLKDGSVHLICHRGWPENQIPGRLEAARRSEFVHRALEEGTDVNGFAVTETPPLEGPLVITPLLTAQGVIEALLCLDEIPTSRLNSSAVRTFYAIGEWISAVLSRLAGDPTLERPTPAMAVLEPTRNWLGTADELGDRLCIEYERTTRYGLPLTVLAIQFVEWTDTTPQGIRKIDQYVIQHFTPRLRVSDAVYRFPHPGCYLVMLPATPVEGAEVVRKRLLRRIEHGPTTTQGEIQITVVAPDPTMPDADSMLMTLTDLYRVHGTLPLAHRRPMTLPETPQVGTLADCVRGLSGEVGLAMRNEYPLQVLALMGERETGVDPGLLAFHLEQVAERTLRRVDSAFSVGASYVAVLLPNTKAEHGDLLGQRILNALKEREAEPSYGEVTYQVMSFGPEYPYYGAFLEALSAVRPLADVKVAGAAP